MGCNDLIVGDVCVHCRERCLRYYPVTRKAICRKNHCVCIGPCPDDKAIPDVKLFKNVKEQILS